MNVVEIGCGEYPGPFFDGADKHYLVEQDMEYLEIAEAKGDYTALHGSDASRIELPGSSVDTVIARNVFGDPDVKIRNSFSGAESSLSLALIGHGGIASFQALQTGLENINYDRKVSFINEASRILVSSGKLLIVEQYTPHVAEKFLSRLSEDVNATHNMKFEETTIDSIAPASYAAAHSQSPRILSWIGTKLG